MLPDTTQRVRFHNLLPGLLLGLILLAVVVYPATLRTALAVVLVVLVGIATSLIGLALFALAAGGVDAATMLVWIAIERLALAASDLDHPQRKRKPKYKRKNSE